MLFVQNHVGWFLRLRRAQKIHNDWKGLKMVKQFWKTILRLKSVNYFLEIELTGFVCVTENQSVEWLKQSIDFFFCYKTVCCIRVAGDLKLTKNIT